MGNGVISGGIAVVGTTFAHSLSNSIIAKNSANLGDQDVRGAFASGGHNLIGILNSDATGFVPSDLRGSDALPLDPRLKPLGWYGGLTQTHALMRNSPALNAGDNTNAPSTDQRGRHRIMGDTIDIGSYEAAFGGGDTDHSQADNWWQPSSSATIDAIVGVGSTGSSPTGGANVSSSSNPVTQRASQRVDAGTRPSGGLQSLF